MSAVKKNATAGRPALVHARHITMGIRLSPEEQAQIEEVAEAEGLKASVWARSILLRALRKVTK